MASDADVTGFIDWLEANFDAVYVSGGSQLKVNGQCPFCGEDRADMRLYVNAKTGIGQCFHCGTAFNAYKFIMAHEGCSYKKAKAIAEGDPNDWDRSQSTPQDAPELAWPAGDAIVDSPEAQLYLKERGITDSLVRHFGMYFARHPVPIGGRLFHSENRIVIPIHDINGRPVSWQARTICKAKPKYLFPPGFKGAETLYNAWSIPKDADYLIICEGLFDVFGWWKHGAKNVVATFGKKISQDQVAIIRRIAPKLVFIAWDSDASWEKFTFAENYGHIFDIRIIDLDGKDADECTGQELAIALQGSKCYSWEAKMLAELSRH